MQKFYTIKYNLHKNICQSNIVICIINVLTTFEAYTELRNL